VIRPGSGFWSAARARRYQEADRQREDRARHGAGKHVDDCDLRYRRRILAATARHNGDGGLLQERAAQGASNEAGEAVADEAEAMFVGRTRGRMGTEEACDRLDRQSPERPCHAISPCA
jgi:hypothetical protein